MNHFFYALNINYLYTTHLFPKLAFKLLFRGFLNELIDLSTAVDKIVIIQIDLLYPCELAISTGTTTITIFLYIYNNRYKAWDKCLTNRF